jgi:hypothetical protein
MLKKNTAETPKGRSIVKKAPPARKISKSKRKRRSSSARAQVQKYKPPSEGRQLTLPIPDCTIQTLEAYAVPKAFESQQQSNGHLTAQARILGLLKRYIGSRVVSLASGTGWLDRKLIFQKERELYNGGNLRLLGIDLTPENKECAEAQMHSLIQKNKIVHTAFSEKRFQFQYMIARLGSAIIIPDSKGNELEVPSFSSIDLKQTVIGCDTADTFLIFMAFVLWVNEREAAIKSIADKSHKAGLKTNPTFVINGEEYPTHITPNAFLRPDFVNAVKILRNNEISTNKLWSVLFPREGFRMVPGQQGKENLGPISDDHNMKYCVLKYEGGSNPHGFRKIQ